MPAKKTAATSKTPAKKPDTKATKAETNAKATAAKATAAKATAKPAAKPAAKAAAPAKRAVARPVTRVARPAAGTAPRAAAVPQKREKRAKVEGKALPTAPQGHAPLIGADGMSTGSIELPAVLATPGKRLATLFQMFIAGRANARQSNAHTKNRARVSGGGAKPWRQKGTGRARQGSTRSPQWRHGGVVFGPNGRRYDQRMPEKMRRAAFAEAMSAQNALGRLFVVEDMKLDGERPRTRDAVTWLGEHRRHRLDRVRVERDQRGRGARHGEPAGDRAAHTGLAASLGRHRRGHRARHASRARCARRSSA